MDSEKTTPPPGAEKPGTETETPDFEFHADDNTNGTPPEEAAPHMEQPIQGQAEKEQRERKERDPRYRFFKDRGFKGDPEISYKVEIAKDFHFPDSLEDFEELVKENFDKLTEKQKNQLNNDQPIWETFIGAETLDWLVKNNLRAEFESIPGPKSENLLPKEETERIKERREKRIKSDPALAYLAENGFDGKPEIAYSLEIYGSEGKSEQKSFRNFESLKNFILKNPSLLTSEQKKSLEQGERFFTASYSNSIITWASVLQTSDPKKLKQIDSGLDLLFKKETLKLQNLIQEKEAREAVKNDPYYKFLTEQQITKPVFEYQLAFPLGKGTDAYKSFGTFEELKAFVEKNSQRFSPDQIKNLERGYGHGYNISLKKGKSRGEDLTREVRELAGHAFSRYIETHREDFSLKKPITKERVAPNEGITALEKRLTELDAKIDKLEQTQKSLRSSIKYIKELNQNVPIDSLLLNLETGENERKKLEAEKKEVRLKLDKLISS